MEYYNKYYDIKVVWEDENDLPILKHQNKILKPYLLKSNTKWSYPIVNTIKGREYCHRIVAFACKMKQYNYFRYNNPGSKIVVDHINGNVLDYRPTNLQFTTNSINVLKSQKIQNKMNPINNEQAKQLKLNK